MMSGRKNIFLGVALAMMMFLSCTRDHLYYETIERGNVELIIDWSKTAFVAGNKGHDERNVLNGVTIFVFDAATGRFVEELPPNPDWQSPRFTLAPGTYDLIVINDSRAELPNIKFNLGMSFEDFCAYIESEGEITTHPDYLTASAVKNVCIPSTHDDYHYDRPDEYYHDYVVEQINTVQMPVTKRVNIRVYVRGMNYCKGMQPSTLTGMAKSVNLFSQTPGKEEAVYAFSLVTREFRNSDYTEALLTHSFNSFGFNEENLKAGSKYVLTINFVLVDNSIYTVTADVTPQFEKWLEEHTINCDLDLDIDLELEVTLPPTTPDTPDNVGGMDPTVLPWSDVTQDITL
ncbi:MAG: DUF5119 domain-containing protein [Bacteroidaceae bacterium]